MSTRTLRRLLIVTAVLIIAALCKAEAADNYNLHAISSDEIRSELGRIKEADPEHRKLGANGVAPGPSRNQSPDEADPNLLRYDRTEPVALVAQTTEKLKTSQDRIHQLEAQLKQASGAGETNRAREQDEGLRLQLAHTTEELKAYRDRVHQLEAQLKRAPPAAELDQARKEADELRSQLAQATEQGRKGRASAPTLEVTSPNESAQKKRPPLSEAEKQPPPSQAGVGYSIPKEEMVQLLSRGDSLLITGDVTSARLFYERGAEAGDREAALRLGQSYDPAFLQRAKLRVRGDTAQALFWYGRARDLGAKEAEILLNATQAK